jgi:NAD(P)-dependent dehydrogenase (short-subunit alcohol dehydrogenase family)
MELSGSIAIVTGGSKGYGKGIAGALKQSGANVWITGRNEATLQQAAEKLDAHAVKANVTSSEDWNKLFDEVLSATDGKLDILVNNAGAGIAITQVAEQTDAQISESIAVNLTGAILGCRRVVPVMRRQGSGTIINISSVCARQAWPGWSVYSAAKAGMVQFSRCLYTEVREYGIRVTSVLPSWGATEFAKAANLPGQSPETESKCIQPQDLGELVVNVCTLPPHLEIQDVTLWPLVQEVVPL